MRGALDMFIRSERLFLRPGWPEDWDEIRARITDQVAVKNLVNWPYLSGSAPEFAPLDSDHRCPNFLITLPSSEGAQLIGCIGLARSAEGVELGYWIAGNHTKRGYATEAARAVLTLARAIGHRRILAGHIADEPGSARVLSKLGFVPTGEMRSRYSLVNGRDLPAAIHAIDLDEQVNCDADSSAMNVA
jgi:RimJ/RimL family protein N-acetyltransferase